MTKLWGLLLLTLGDVMLVRHLCDKTKKQIRCLWEMIGFLGAVTHGVSQWKRTLEKAILQEKYQGEFPKILQEKFAAYRKNSPLRDALQKALKELPLPEEACEICSRYFSQLGKVTEKSTVEYFLQSKKRLEALLEHLQEEVPKTTKLISAGVYSISAVMAVLLL